MKHTYKNISFYDKAFTWLSNTGLRKAKKFLKDKKVIMIKHENINKIRVDHHTSNQINDMW